MKKTIQTCNFGTLVPPPINSTAYISSTFKPEFLSTSFRGTRAFSHRSSQSSSNFSRDMVLLGEEEKKSYKLLIVYQFHYLGANYQYA
jgi:hypothetical protein